MSSQKALDGFWVALVQIVGGAEMSLINKDTLFIEQDGIPDGGRSGILESENTEVERLCRSKGFRYDVRNDMND